MATEDVTRSIDNGARSILLCGRPACDRTADLVIEFEWNDWTGIIGACWEHHEDLAVLQMKARGAEGES